MFKKKKKKGYKKLINYLKLKNNFNFLFFSKCVEKKKKKKKFKNELFIN